MKNIKVLNVFEYYKEIGILDFVLNNYTEIPNTIVGLVDLLDRDEFNFWSYSVDDEKEIKNFENVVLVEDLEENQRYFETIETEIIQKKMETYKTDTKGNKIIYNLERYYFKKNEVTIFLNNQEYNFKIEWK